MEQFSCSISSWGQRLNPAALSSAPEVGKGSAGSSKGFPLKATNCCDIWWTFYAEGTFHPKMRNNMKKYLLLDQVICIWHRLSQGCFFFVSQDVVKQNSKTSDLRKTKWKIWKSPSLLLLRLLGDQTQSLLCPPYWCWGGPKIPRSGYFNNSNRWWKLWEAKTSCWKKP